MIFFFDATQLIGFLQKIFKFKTGTSVGGNINTGHFGPPQFSVINWKQSFVVCH